MKDYRQTIAFDFDGVIHNYHGWKGEDIIDGEPIKNIVSVLKLLATNYRLVIISSRAINPAGKQAILDWLDKYKLSQYFEEVTPVKVPAIAYIDDRAVEFKGVNSLISKLKAIDIKIPTRGVVLVGLPASGKSTMAYDFEKQGYIVISTDDIREELGCLNDMSRNSEVFDIFYKRIEEYSEKHNVVIDATNINIESRERVLDVLKSDIVDAIYLNISVYELLERNHNRSKQVPDEVIINMSSRLEEPTKAEGFDSITEIRG